MHASSDDVKQYAGDFEAFYDAKQHQEQSEIKQKQQKRHSISRLGGPTGSVSGSSPPPSLRDLDALHSALGPGGELAELLSALGLLEELGGAVTSYRQLAPAVAQAHASLNGLLSDLTAFLNGSTDPTDRSMCTGWRARTR